MQRSPLSSSEVFCAWIRKFISLLFKVPVNIFCKMQARGKLKTLSEKFLLRFSLKILDGIQKHESLIGICAPTRSWQIFEKRNEFFKGRKSRKITRKLHRLGFSWGLNMAHLKPIRHQPKLLVTVGVPDDFHSARKLQFVIVLYENFHLGSS